MVAEEEISPASPRRRSLPPVMDGQDWGSERLLNLSGGGSPLANRQGVQTIEESMGLVLMLLLTGLGIAGNLAVIAVILKTLRLRKFLFILHLCLVDLLSALTLMPLGIASSTALLGSGSLCRTYLSLGICLSGVSILTTAAINVERYYYIVHPLRYEVKMTFSLTVSTLLLIWTEGTLASLMPLLAWTPQPGDPGKATRCSLHWGTGALGKAFALLFSLGCFALPALLIFSVYCSVFRVARVAALQPSRAAPPRHGPDSETTTVSRGRVPRLPPDKRFGGGKAAVTLMIIGGQFLACWLPYFAYHLHTVMASKTVSTAWETVVTWLAYSSFTINPFCYGCLNRQIRAELIRWPKCFFRQPEDVQFGVSSHEGSVEENFLQFLHRTSCAADRPGRLASSPGNLLNQASSRQNFRLPGQIPEQPPEPLSAREKKSHLLHQA
ncbi:G-protein coupled receptor 61-like [Heptranchias perlo]|uniref:G-protein coupled receptor 61-like n=1 Tax=Heptranchias perlo TaxID=212740 RepID=UPI00355960B0